MAEHASRRARFVAAKAGLAHNAPWGVHDYLAKCWAVDPKLSKAEAEARATAMDRASRGRGR
jgi:hypothetical protein